MAEDPAIVAELVFERRAMRAELQGLREASAMVGSLAERRGRRG